MRSKKNLKWAEQRQISAQSPEAGKHTGGAAFCKYTENTYILQGNHPRGKSHIHTPEHTHVRLSLYRSIRSIVIDELMIK